jgi:hypothetical protein
MTGRGSQGACRQDDLNVDKPAVVKQILTLTLTLTSCFLVTDLNNGDFSASVANVITIRRISHN